MRYALGKTAYLQTERSPHLSVMHPHAIPAGPLLFYFTFVSTHPFLIVACRWLQATFVLDGPSWIPHVLPLIMPNSVGVTDDAMAGVSPQSATTLATPHDSTPSLSSSAAGGKQLPEGE